MTENTTTFPTGSRSELRDLVRTQLQILLEDKNFEGAKALLIPVQPVDIAEAISGLPEAMRAIAFRLLNKAKAIEVYEHLDLEVQQSLLERFKAEEALEIIDSMSPASLDIMGENVQLCNILGASLAPLHGDKLRFCRGVWHTSCLR